MPAPPCLPLAEINRVVGDYRAIPATYSNMPPVVALAEDLLARCMPPNWALEWSLPWWLGQAWGIAPEITHELVLANVLGLTCIRVHDDLVDGQFQGTVQVPALLWGAVLLRAWTGVYTRIGLTTPIFWRSFDEYLAQWVAATWHGLVSPDSFALHDDEALLALAHRGAPLKACVAAACTLTGRSSLQPLLTQAVDDLLVAAVLLDHAQDWAEDLAAGRWNAFAWYAAGSGRSSQVSTEAGRAIAQEMTIGLGGRPYFAVIRRYLRSAADHAEAAQVQSMVEYIRWLGEAASTFRSRWARQERQRLRETTSVLLVSQAQPRVLSSTT